MSTASVGASDTAPPALAAFVAVSPSLARSAELLQSAFAIASVSASESTRTAERNDETGGGILVDPQGDLAVSAQDAIAWAREQLAAIQG